MPPWCSAQFPRPCAPAMPRARLARLHRLPLRPMPPRPPRSAPLCRLGPAILLFPACPSTRRPFRRRLPCAPAPISSGRLERLRVSPRCCSIRFFVASRHFPDLLFCSGCRTLDLGFQALHISFHVGKLCAQIFAKVVDMGAHIQLSCIEARVIIETQDSSLSRSRACLIGPHFACSCRYLELYTVAAAESGVFTDWARLAGRLPRRRPALICVKVQSIAHPLTCLARL